MGKMLDSTDSVMKNHKIPTKTIVFIFLLHHPAKNIPTRKTNAYGVAPSKKPVLNGYE